MKMLFNKNPLLYKEWRSSRWVSLLMAISLFWFKGKNTFEAMSYRKSCMAMDKTCMLDKMWFNEYLLEWSDGGYEISLALVVLLTILLFKGEKQSSTCDLLHSMPFKRKDIIIAKIKVGFTAIIIPFILNFLIMTCFYFKNKEYIGSAYSDIPKYYAMNLLACLFFFAFLVFIQTIIGQYIASIIVAAIVSVVPKVLCSFIVEFKRLKYNLDYHDASIIKLGEISNNLNIYEINSTWRIDKSIILPNGEISSEFYKYVYKNFNTKIMVLVSLIVLFTVLSVVMYNKIKLEKINELIMFKPLKMVFKVGAGICFAVVVCEMFAFPKNFEPVNMPLIYITLLLGLFVGYFISKLVIKFCNR